MRKASDIAREIVHISLNDCKEQTAERQVLLLLSVISTTHYMLNGITSRLRENVNSLVAAAFATKKRALQKHDLDFLR